MYLYLYLGILTNIEVVIQSKKLFDTYNYMSKNTRIYLQLYVFYTSLNGITE